MPAHKRLTVLSLFCLACFFSQACQTSVTPKANTSNSYTFGYDYTKQSLAGDPTSPRVALDSACDAQAQAAQKDYPTRDINLTEFHAGCLKAYNDDTKSSNQ